MILFGSLNREVFHAGFRRERMAIFTTAGEPGAGGVSNELLATGESPVLLETARIENNNMYVQLPKAPVKPIFEQRRLPLQEAQQDRNNSDRARNVDKRALFFKARMGFGIGEPYSLIQVTIP